MLGTNYTNKLTIQVLQLQTTKPEVKLDV